MSTLTVTAKGQITLKQELLRHLNVVPGQKVEVEKLPDGRIVVGAPDVIIGQVVGTPEEPEPAAIGSRRPSCVETESPTARIPSGV